jgi:hypothetical protein
MKNSIKVMAGMLLSFITAGAFAQETPVQPQTQPQTNTWDAKKNPTVDSILSKYSAKYVAPKAPLTTNDIFPVIGQYESVSNTEAAPVSIALDETNKGLIWVSGLPQGRIKAMLRKSPSIYKIPAQKTEEGKEISEGTLVFDKETNTLNIIIGTPYNTEDPASVFVSAQPEMQEAQPKVTKSKTKKPATPKTFSYTGTKQVEGTVAN